jgi:AraC family transcriptional regulator
MRNSDKVAKALGYIDLHFDEELTLEQLSNLACISKYHFHRLFTAVNGLSLHQYIRWLKLKRAANQLLYEKDKSILEIALNAGFESHEAFTRAFKLACDETPSKFRQESKWKHWDSIPYLLERAGSLKVTPVIKDFPGVRLAIIEHRAAPETIPQSIEKLIAWAKKNNLSKPKAGEIFSIPYDDPKTTLTEQFRYDIGRIVPENMRLTGQVIEKRLPSGRVAIGRHEGSHDNLDRTVYAMYHDWLSSSDEELADLPCVFCFQNFSREVPETALKTDIYFFLKNK